MPGVWRIRVSETSVHNGRQVLSGACLCNQKPDSSEIILNPSGADSFTLSHEFVHLIWGDCCRQQLRVTGTLIDDGTAFLDAVFVDVAVAFELALRYFCWPAIIARRHLKRLLWDLPDDAPYSIAA